jgi:glutathione S-transferase
MILIGPNRSPYTRRVAITLNIYSMPYEQRPLSGFDDRAAVRSWNPLGRIPALVLDSGETLVDSVAIIDHLDEIHGREWALTPPAGAERRAVLKVAALLMGVCDKGLQSAYERNQRPPDKWHQPWIDDCVAQAANALEEMIQPDTRYLFLDRLTQADVVAERFARGALRVDTGLRMPRLHAIARRLAEQPPFIVTEHAR